MNQSQREWHLLQGDRAATSGIGLSSVATVFLGHGSIFILEGSSPVWKIKHLHPSPSLGPGDSLFSECLISVQVDEPFWRWVIPLVKTVKVSTLGRTLQKSRGFILKDVLLMLFRGDQASSQGGAYSPESFPGSHP